MTLNWKIVGQGVEIEIDATLSVDCVALRNVVEPHIISMAKAVDELVVKTAHQLLTAAKIEPSAQFKGFVASRSTSSTS